MSKSLNGVSNALSKTVASLTSIATVLSLSGFAALAPLGAIAATPSDYGLTEGDTISAAGSDDPDVYIVNEQGYKRLFLNPVIFNYYGHLGGFANVKNVTAATRDAFPTSGLFRNCETNDQKVYGFVSTSEDVGYLKWVNTSGAQAVADDPMFFNKVFCVNTTEFNWYDKDAGYFTSVNEVPSYTRVGGTATPVPGNVSVSLSPANPASATVTGGASGVEMLRLRMTGTGTVSTMTFKRYGAGTTGDFSNIYVYDGATRLTSGKSLSAATGEVTFINLNASVNGSKDLSLVGDINITQTVGNVHGFQLTSVGLSSGTVSGTPISGNLFQVSGADSGDIDVSKVGSGFLQPSVGQQGAQLSEFKLAANTEGAWVKRITLLQGGTVKASDITNVKIKTGTTEWSGSVTSTGYLVFDLGSGHFIAKGNE